MNRCRRNVRRHDPGRSAPRRPDRDESGHAPQYERPHDDFADVGLTCDQTLEVAALHAHHPGVAWRPGSNQDFPLVEKVHFAGELRARCVVNTVDAP